MSSNLGLVTAMRSVRASFTTFLLPRLTSSNRTFPPVSTRAGFILADGESEEPPDVPTTTTAGKDGVRDRLGGGADLPAARGGVGQVDREGRVPLLGRRLAAGIDDLQTKLGAGPGGLEAEPERAGLLVLINVRCRCLARVSRRGHDGPGCEPSVGQRLRQADLRSGRDRLQNQKSQQLGLVVADAALTVERSEDDGPLANREPNCQRRVDRNSRRGLQLALQKDRDVVAVEGGGPPAFGLEMERDRGPEPSHEAPARSPRPAGLAEPPGRPKRGPGLPGRPTPRRRNAGRTRRASRLR